MPNPVSDTNQVKATFVEGAVKSSGGSISPEEAAAEFDRWLFGQLQRAHFEAWHAGYAAHIDNKSVTEGPSNPGSPSRARRVAKK